MNNMPTKDPNAWAVMWAPIAAWLSEHRPPIWGCLLTVAISWMRITYQGGKGQQRTNECVLIGLIWLLVCITASLSSGSPIRRRLDRRRHRVVGMGPDPREGQASV